MREMFGDVEVVIAPMTASVSHVDSGVIRTAGGGEPPSLKRVVAGLVTGFAEDLETVRANLKALAPDEIVLELTVGLSEEVKAWILGAKGEQTFKVTLTWTSVGPNK